MSKHFDKAKRELIKKEKRKLQIEQKTIIFWKGIVGFIQKYLPMLYKAVKPKELNQ